MLTKSERKTKFTYEYWGTASTEKLQELRDKYSGELSKKLNKFQRKKTEWKYSQVMEELSKRGF